MVRNGEIQAQKTQGQPWTARLLFPMRAMAKSIGKVFVTPFDFLLGLLVVAIVFVELFSDGSWMLYVFSMLVLGADVFERYLNRVFPQVVEGKPVTKEKHEDGSTV